MTLNASDLHDNVVSVPQQLGIFDTVIGYEPKSAPTGGRVAAVWLRDVKPMPAASGLAATAGVVTFTVRVYVPMLSEPQDQVEKALLDSADALFTAFSADFELDASVRNVDLLGESGQALTAVTGYTSIDNTLFRIVDVTVPLIVNDVWSQTA